MNFTWVLVVVILAWTGHATGRDLVPLEAPANLTLLDITRRQVLIQWDPVDSSAIRGSFLGYLVRTWNDAASQVYAFPPDITKASVEFFPFSKNFITVSVQNEKYVGPPSDALSFDAPQIEPNQPELIEVFTLSSRAVLIRWAKPTRPNGLLLGYKIHSEVDAGNKNVHTIDDPHKLQAKLTGMALGVTYKIGVSAFNCAGEGDIRTTQIRLEDRPSAEPFPSSFMYRINYTVPRREDVCAQALQTVTYEEVEPEKHCLVDCLVLWLPDVDNNPGEYFYVKYRKTGEREFETTEPETSEDFIVLHNFDACKNYEIVVTAVDGNYSTDSLPVNTQSALNVF